MIRSSIVSGVCGTKGLQKYSKQYLMDLMPFEEVPEVEELPVKKRRRFRRGLIKAAPDQ